MWCTRWYLPLVLLPWPVAPPYFVLLFIFSTTLHAKPCFYCIVLLSALFMSSCYWPPVPLDSALTSPWSANITTFSDALQSLMPDLAMEDRPEMVPMADRCWCDISGSGGIFKPYNVTQWELNSVLRLKEDLEKKRETRVQKEKSADAVGSENATDADEDNHTVVAPSSTGLDDALPHSNSPKMWSIWEMVWSSFPASDSALNASLSIPPTQPNVATATPPPEHNRSASYSGSSSPPISPPAQPRRSPPLSRTAYDLRPYGFALVLDFGWSHNK
ncbi:hypothetical protein B0H21DRAFT_765707 [Amylocystis lapponica]|nr:hypothetical protein B0H21DRAFT_765707 [Amylocystis lapponica]